jgi:transcription elongation factor GreB
MSKAFTRESDDEADLPTVPRPASPLPPGAKNYITVGGVRKLRQERNHLLQEERPPIAARSATDEVNRRSLQLLDQRILQIQESLNSAVVVPPPPDADATVRFGATVTVRERGGALSRYRIVGVDETDIEQGWVSWLSPIARALLSASTGQRVRIKLPAGEEELEVVKVAYADETEPTPPWPQRCSGNSLQPRMDTDAHGCGGTQ